MRTKSFMNILLPKFTSIYKQSPLVIKASKRSVEIRPVFVYKGKILKDNRKHTKYSEITLFAFIITSVKYKLKFLSA